MRKIVLYIFFGCLLFVTAGIKAQPFADEIAAFKKADSIAYPFRNQHPILFIGSSSFRKWEDLQGAFPGYPVLNRGFGGSTLPDVIRYADDIIFPYYPKQVVIYCGENDLAAPGNVTAGTVFKRFKELALSIWGRLPYASIVFVSIKPSPSRQSIQLKVVEANRLIRSFLKKKQRGEFVDVYYPMLNPDGTMKKELFLADDLHMNAKGYAIWQELITPYLLK